jgi:tetratricopeptide (TPR) repeat protein
MSVEVDYTPFFESGRWTDALMLARQALERDPVVAGRHADYGTFLSLLGRDQEAYEHFLKAFRLAPEELTHLQSAFYSLYRLRDAPAYIALAKCERGPHARLLHLLVEDCEDFYVRPDFAELMGHVAGHP